jgi:hypothetical protein
MERKQFALELLYWHSGQFSGVYAVGSSLISGNVPDKDSIERAISELYNIKQTAKFPEFITKWDVDECNRIANELQKMLGE